MIFARDAAVNAIRIKQVVSPLGNARFVKNTVPD